MSRQQVLEFRNKPGKRGGRRARAGRKPSEERKRVAHRRRGAFRKLPVHVTLRVCPEIASLRRHEQYAAIRRQMIASGHKDDFRIVHFSVQGNHLHPFT